MVIRWLTRSTKKALHWRSWIAVFPLAILAAYLDFTSIEWLMLYVAAIAYAELDIWARRGR